MIGLIFWAAVDVFSHYMGVLLTPVMNKLFPPTKEPWDK